MMRNTLAAEDVANNLGHRFSKIILTDYQPTCENMLADFAERLLGALPEDIELHSLRLHETATSYAEWYASDNF
jgi:6-pyruvoyltetrahydropterin/6-carboxytetrahydropterin synthase